MRSVWLRGAGGSFVVRGASAALALASTLVLTRALGVDGFGAYAWAVSSVSVLALVSALGLDVLLMRDAAALRARSRWSELHALLHWSDRTALAVALSFGLAAATGALIVGGRLPDHLLVALAALPLITLATLRQGALQGLQRPAAGMAVTTLMRQLPFLCLLGAALLLSGGELGSLAALALQVTACGIALAGGTMVLRALLPSSGEGRTPGGPAARWLRQSIPMGISAGLTNLGSQLPLIGLGVLVSGAEAGIYAAAVNLTLGFSMLLMAGRAPWSALAARLWATGEHDRLQRGLTTSTRWTGGISLALAVVLAVLAEPVMSLFGAAFEEGADVLRLLVVANVANAVVAFNGSTLVMCGRQAAAARASLAALVVTVALIGVLVPGMGAEGAALAFVGGTLLRNLANTIQAWRMLGLDTSMLGLRPRGARRAADTPAGSG